MHHRQALPVVDVYDHVCAEGVQVNTFHGIARLLKASSDHLAHELEVNF